MTQGVTTREKEWTLQEYISASFYLLGVRQSLPVSVFKLRPEKGWEGKKHEDQKSKELHAYKEVVAVAHDWNERNRQTALTNEAKGRCRSFSPLVTM
jgi:hypothetical protein